MKDCDCEGMHGPSVVARDIVSTGLVWHEAQSVAPEAWQALAATCRTHLPMLQAFGNGDPSWRLHQYTDPEWKVIARCDPDQLASDAYASR